MDGTSKRVVIVGGVAGGASCAARARRLDEAASIVVFERGPYPSFANCGLPYFIGGVIADQQKLLVAGPELFRERFRVDVRTEHEVTRIDRERQVVVVRDLARDVEFEEPYDALVLATGAAPIRPPLPGIDGPGLFAVRTIPDSVQIRRWLDERQARSAVVVGGGFIGLEMAENLAHRGLKVAIIEAADQVMAPLDPEMAEPVHAHLRSRGVDLHLRTPVAAFETLPGDRVAVLTGTGLRLEADLVILAIGVRPEVGLARAAGLAIGGRGGVTVDAQMRTSDPHIWAVGDMAEVHDVVTGAPTLLALAGPANRQGRIAADAIFGRDTSFRGVQGTAVCGVFDLTVASTGAAAKTLRRIGRPFAEVYLHPNQHAGYYPGAQTIHLKLLFDPGDGRILGAQAVGTEGVEKRIDVIATALQFGGTVHDLEAAELCYAPQYGSAKDPVNLAGMIASNALRGDAPLADWSSLADEAGLVLDVREPAEFAAGHLPGAVNIPLGQLRDRLAEIPRDRPVRAYCKVGQRGYYAVRALRLHGLDARQLSGGYLTYRMRAGAAGLAPEGPTV